MNQLQGTDTNSEDSYSDDDSPKRRRDLLTRRPSYHRILKDITGPDIAGEYSHLRQFPLPFRFFPAFEHFFGWIKSMFKFGFISKGQSRPVDGPMFCCPYMDIA